MTPWPAWSNGDLRHDARRHRLGDGGLDVGVSLHRERRVRRKRQAATIAGFLPRREGNLPRANLDIPMPAGAKPPRQPIDIVRGRDGEDVFLFGIDSDSDRLIRQHRVGSWVESTFGSQALARNERGRRFAEEAIELAQAAGVSREQLIALVTYVYGREPGDLYQENGEASGSRCLALRMPSGCRRIAPSVTRLARIEAFPAEHFRARQKRIKADAGLSMRLSEEG